jgi:hypothetical protein
MDDLLDYEGFEGTTAGRNLKLEILVLGSLQIQRGAPTKDGTLWQLAAELRSYFSARDS